MGGPGRPPLRVDNPPAERTIHPPLMDTSTTEKKQQTPTPAQIPFTDPAGLGALRHRHGQDPAPQVHRALREAPARRHAHDQALAQHAAHEVSEGAADALAAGARKAPVFFCPDRRVPRQQAMAATARIYRGTPRNLALLARRIRAGRPCRRPHRDGLRARSGRDQQGGVPEDLRGEGPARRAIPLIVHIASLRDLARVARPNPGRAQARRESSGRGRSRSSSRRPAPCPTRRPRACRASPSGCPPIRFSAA